MIYCLSWLLTVIDLVPDVMVGVLPQPGELPLTTCPGVLVLVATKVLDVVVGVPGPDEVVASGVQLPERH